MTVTAEAARALRIRAGVKALLSGRTAPQGQAAANARAVSIARHVAAMID